MTVVNSITVTTTCIIQT